MANSILYASLMCLVAAAPSVAAPPFESEVPQALVRYGDIDLASSDGAQRLQARVKRAADRVCDTRESDLGAIMAANKCKRAAVARAMPQVELAIANARSGQLAQTDRVSDPSD